MTKKNKKPAIIFISVIFIIAVLSLSVYIVTEIFSKTEMPPTSSNDVFLYTPDYNSDIMSEEDYLILDRSIKYSDGFGTWDIYKDDKALTDVSIQLFLIEYINTLVDGDGEKLHALYSEQVINALKIPNKITEQRIYETVFTEITAKEMKEDGVTFFRYEVKAEYKIMRNDGTFRADVESRAVKAQYLTVDMIGDQGKIVAVVEYAIPQ